MASSASSPSLPPSTAVRPVGGKTKATRFIISSELHQTVATQRRFGQGTQPAQGKAGLQVGACQPCCAASCSSVTPRRSAAATQTLSATPVAAPVASSRAPGRIRRWPARSVGWRSTPFTVEKNAGKPVPFRQQSLSGTDRRCWPAAP